MYDPTVSIWKKKILTPTQKIKFLGIILDSVELTLLKKKVRENKSDVFSNVKGTTGIGFRTGRS